jgi:hypothetical protein
MSKKSRIVRTAMSVVDVQTQFGTAGTTNSLSSSLLDHSVGFARIQSVIV